MLWLQRDPANPLLLPSTAGGWDSRAAFNPCVLRDADRWHLLYRAEAPADSRGYALSTIGHATSADGVHFGERRQILRPEFAWEQFGCEDPRITRLDGRCYIFYTCLSMYPFEAAGIRVGLALTEDFVHFEKHPVTPFNAKAMALFPERIDGKLAAILTVHTDMPPAKVAVALFDHPEDIWSDEYWQAWYRRLDQHVIALLRSPADHVEVGAPPLRTESGWLMVNSYIRDYYTRQRSFRVEAALLDLACPLQLRSRTSVPLLQADAEYERKGSVENVVFPSGAVIDGDDLVVYYGAADTSCCAARGALPSLLAELTPPLEERFVSSPLSPQGCERYSGNPILRPRPEFAWEAKAVFNPGAVQIGRRVHLLYRAMSLDGTSTLGYASSEDGVHFVDRPAGPVYVPRESFELKLRPGNSGCEDPRLSLLDGRVYLFYTAFDGYTPRLAYSHLAIDDFLARRWDWEAPMVITPPGIDDKDGCLLPARLNGQYVIFHRAGDDIRINRFPGLRFGDGHWLDHKSARIRPRKDYWDNRKFGIAAPPIETPHGWLLFFHRVTSPHSVYKVEAMLLDRADPSRILHETGATLLEPETPEERHGQVANVVFPCGAVQRQEQIYLYYGGADSVVCVARIALETIYRRLGI